MKFLALSLILTLSSSLFANGVGTPHSNVAGPETTDIMGYGTPGGGGVENELRPNKEEILKKRQQKMEAEEAEKEEEMNQIQDQKSKKVKD